MSRPAKLPVWRTLAECFRLLAVRRRVVVKSGWFPFVLWIAGLYLLGFALPPPWVTEMVARLVLAAHSAWGVVVLTLLFVPWFRSVAEHEPAVHVTKLRVHVQHGGWLLLIALGMYLCSWTQDALLDFAGLNVTFGPWNVIAAPLKSVLPLYLFARIGLVLPATAVHGNGSLREAWVQSRGNGLRLAAIFMIPLFSFGLLGGLLWQEIESVFLPGQETAAAFAGTLYGSFFVFLNSLIMATALAILYRSTADSV